MSKYLANSFTIEGIIEITVNPKEFDSLMYFACSSEANIGRDIAIDDEIPDILGSAILILLEDFIERDMGARLGIVENAHRLNRYKHPSQWGGHYYRNVISYGRISTDRI